MTLPVHQFSEDQAEAFDTLGEALRGAGVDIEESTLTPPGSAGLGVFAIVGKAGSGKTMLLSKLAEALSDAGVETISGDYEGRRRKDRRTLAILAPTNKAASVLRNHGVAATTIHRILYTPVYHPEY
jgi:exodeoxyribonuclease V